MSPGGPKTGPYPYGQEGAPEGLDGLKPHGASHQKIMRDVLCLAQSAIVFSLYYVITPYVHGSAAVSA